LFIAAIGSLLNSDTLKSNSKLSDGSIEIITEITDVDGNDQKPAIMSMTYNFGAKSYSYVKEVKCHGQQHWITRHDYRYSRK
jgi:hypothetical protein